MEQAELFYRFGTALFIGFLIGLEREQSNLPVRVRFAGIRTFPLFALSGCGAAMVADLTGSPLPYVAIMGLLAVIMGVGYYAMARDGHVGATTEAAAVVTILVGSLCYWGYIALATALGVTVTLLLSLKLELHRFAAGITREDVYATLKFAAITAIVLPVLPNATFGPPPFDVLNPYRIWLMVVFISGISFSGYILLKLVNLHSGIGLMGLLGGLVSSTAVTLSLSQRSRRHSSLARPFALAIILSWTVLFPRVMVQVAAVNSRLLAAAWLPLTITFAATLVYAAFLFATRGQDDNETIEMSNPFELKPALAFGALYALVLLISRGAELYFGATAVYISAIVAGLADVNAITLTMAEMSRPVGGLDPHVASQAIMLAILSNTVVKAAMVFVAASAQLRWAIIPSVVIILVAGASSAFLL
jgi:uncharacterized membrane protein (DUF4010 family)